MPISTKVLSFNPLYGVIHPTLSDKVYQWLAVGWWFSPGTQVLSTNKTDHHDVTQILLKVVLNTINLTPLIGMFHKMKLLYIT